LLDIIIIATRRPPGIFLTLALGLGLAFLVVNPPFAVNDEDVHLARVYELSTGRLTTRSDEQGEYHEVPEDYVALGARYWRMVEPGDQARVDVGELWQQVRAGRAKAQVHFPGRAGAYAPICYLPQILAVWLVRHFDVSVLVHLYAARLASLLGYIALAWMAIRVSAQLQWLFMIIALTPIALTQAAGVSADGTVIGLSLLFFALAAKAVCMGDTLSRKELVGLAVAVIALTVCKPVYLMVVTCLPALFWTRRGQALQTASLLAVSTLLAAGLYAGWASLIPAQPGPPDPNTDTLRQLAFLREHPTISSSPPTRRCLSTATTFLPRAFSCAAEFPT
jgi:uncharacterized membrane protein